MAGSSLLYYDIFEYLEDIFCDTTQYNLFTGDSCLFLCITFEVRLFSSQYIIVVLKSGRLG
jgi:hypothetical protein